MHALRQAVAGNAARNGRRGRPDAIPDAAAPTDHGWWPPWANRWAAGCNLARDRDRNRRFARCRGNAAPATTDRTCAGVARDLARSQAFGMPLDSPQERGAGRCGVRAANGGAPTPIEPGTASNWEMRMDLLRGRLLAQTAEELRRVVADPRYGAGRGQAIHQHTHGAAFILGFLAD